MRADDLVCFLRITVVVELTKPYFWQAKRQQDLVDVERKKRKGWAFGIPFEAPELGRRRL